MSDFKAFSDSNDLNRIKVFLENGLIVSGTFLVMERAVTAKDGEYKEAHAEYYDTWDLKDYLDADEMSFGKRKDESVLNEQLSYEKSAILVINEKGRPVSSVTVWLKDEETYAAENIFTVPSYRRKGLAEALLKETFKKAFDDGIKKIRLNVYADNAPAISLYLKLGFEVTGSIFEFTDGDSNE